MPSLVEIGSVLEKKMKIWKVYDDNDNNDNDNNDYNDDNDGQRTHFDQKSSREPSAQVSLKTTHVYPIQIIMINCEKRAI